MVSLGTEVVVESGVGGDGAGGALEIVGSPT